MKKHFKYILRVVFGYINYVVLASISKAHGARLTSLISITGHNISQVYIVGAGPSAATFPFEIVAPEDAVIFINHAYELHTRVVSKAKYALSADTGRISELSTKIKKGTLIRIFCPPDLNRVRLLWWLRHSEFSLVPKSKIKAGKLVSDNSWPSTIYPLSVPVNHMGTSSLFVAMQVGLLMEPRRLVLVGIDLDNSKGCNYFKPGIKAGFTTQYDGRIQKEFSSAISSIKERGVEVSRWVGNGSYSQL